MEKAKFGIDRLQELEDVFGPDLNFTSAEIIGIRLDRNFDRLSPSLTVDIWACEIRYERFTQEVSIRFDGIDDLTIEGFNHQNVISAVIFSEKNGRFQAEWTSKFGAYLSLSYESGSVLRLSDKAFLKHQQESALTQ